MPSLPPSAFLFSVLFFTSLLTPSWAQQTFFPGRVPLAIRSPYLSSWVSVPSDSSYTGQWPSSTLGSTLGWAGLVRIDQNNTFSWLGLSQAASAPGVSAATFRRTVITPTQTIITLDAGSLMEINVTFISPIEVADPVKQSIPFSYLVFEARSLDNRNHTVQVYSDISGEWTSPDGGASIRWGTTTDRPNDLYHDIALQTPAEFQENRGLATWGTVHYATRKDGSVTFATAPDNVARRYFVANGTLNGQLDATFRPISGNGNLSYPVFSFAKDLGSIRATASPIVYAVGHTFETNDSAAVQYQDLSGTSTKRALYYVSQYNADVGSVIDNFLSDFEAARTRAQQMDDKILGAASSAISGQDYADLVSLATRQVFGTTQLSIARGTDGTWNTSDVMMFMRDTGAGNPNRVNPVETLYASFPMFIHIDPSLGAPLLEPLLRFQATSQYTISFAAADLGTGYPSAEASNTAHNQSVEQTGNMIIMAYAQAKATNDNSLIGRYYSLLKSWADYLGGIASAPHDTVSADMLATNNQTNLAFKGIIAIQAMSGISSKLGQTADAQKYSDQAKSLYSQWESDALDTDKHVLLAYGKTPSFSIGYNLFADRWLGTNLVNSEVFEAQAKFIENLKVSGSNTQFGYPIDSSNSTLAAASWSMFAAAALGNGQAQTDIVSAVHNRASFNTTNDIFPDRYDSSSGALVGGAGSPAVGAAYAPMMVSQTSGGASGSNNDSSSSSSHAGAIAGGVVGGLAGLVAIVSLAFFFWRRRSQQRRNSRPRPMSIDTGANVSHGGMPDIEELSPLRGTIATQEYDPSRRGLGGGVTVTPFISPVVQRLEGEGSTQQSGHVRTQTESDFSLYNPYGSTVEGSSPTSPPGSQRPLPPVPVVGAIPLAHLSSKELQELRRNMANNGGMVPGRYVTNASEGSGRGLSDQVGRDRTESEAGGSSSNGSQGDIEAARLRQDLEGLRREVLMMKAERMDAPPSYGE